MKLVLEVIEKCVYVCRGGEGKDKTTAFLQYFVKLLQHFLNSIFSFAA